MLRSVKYGLSGALVAGLVGGTVAFTDTTDKTVHLAVDGIQRVVHTDAGTVGGLLAGQHLQAGAHDLLAPSASSALHDGETVVFKRGRLLHLSIDGVDKNVWTTAPTVSVAMADLGYTTNDLLSVSRSTRLPLTPTDVVVRTPRSVTVLHDGKTTTVDTTDITVGQLLKTLSLSLGRDDRLSTGYGAVLTDGMRIRVTRVQHRVLTENQPIPFQSTTKVDMGVPAGTTKITQKGQAGVRQLRWSVVYIDGKLAGKTQLAPVVTRAPRMQVTSIGGQGDSATAYQAIARSLLGSYGWDDSQFSCLVQMWNRESRWTTTAANSAGAYGIPQALPGSKMASVGPDWQTNPRTQIIWGLGYIKSRYGSPCNAWGLWQQQGWY